MNAPRVLIIAPDYASHVYPLLAVAGACRDRGMLVTFATGPSMETAVHRTGLSAERLILGPASNPGIMRPEGQGREADHMRAFYEATKRGPVETLIYQSKGRQHDMLYEPEATYVRIRELIQRTDPDLVVVDQLSYGATLALHALGRPFASFHPGHPAAIPGLSEMFGVPAVLPPPLESREEDLARLRTACRAATITFTAAFNATLARLAPAAPPVADAFAFTSPWLVLLNYPAELAAGRNIPRSAHFLGSCLRDEEPDRELESQMLGLSRRPLVYVSFGTFLSAREDVLRRVARALRDLPVNVVLASGPADVAAGQALPSGWIVRPVLPQLQVLRRADLVITHGGNNTLTEALTFGVPLLVGPFSSDQFDTAQDVLAGGVGAVFDPNRVEPQPFAARVRALLNDTRVRKKVRTLARSLQPHGGRDRAAALIATCIDTGAPRHYAADAPFSPTGGTPW